MGFHQLHAPQTQSNIHYCTLPLYAIAMMHGHESCSCRIRSPNDSGEEWNYEFMFRWVNMFTIVVYGKRQCFIRQTDRWTITYRIPAAAPINFLCGTRAKREHRTMWKIVEMRREICNKTSKVNICKVRCACVYVEVEHISWHRWWYCGLDLFVDWQWLIPSFNSASCRK